MRRWLDLAALWLKPIYQMILGGMWGDGYVQIDETVIKYLAPGTGKAQQGYFWTVKRPDGDTVFHWSTERAAAVPDAPAGPAFVPQIHTTSPLPLAAGSRASVSPLILSLDCTP